MATLDLFSSEPAPPDQARMLALHAQLHHHAHQYYVLDAPASPRCRIRPLVSGVASN